MGCCMCKKVLKILAGIALILASVNMLPVNPWMVLGLFLLLAGLAPFVCQNCESGCCSTGKKK